MRSISELNTVPDAVTDRLDRAGSEGQDEQRRVWLVFKLDDPKPLALNQGDDFVRAGVADVEPDYFRRTSMNETPFAKVGILGDDRELVGFFLVPNLVIARCP